MKKISSELKRLRHHLHSLAELSEQETKTAEFIAHRLKKLGSGHIIRGLGGNGVAAVYAGKEKGPTVLLRSELDALPISETRNLAHGSKNQGVSHRCGHDGHMAILLGVAALLAKNPPARGRAVLLFQPAEETGQGAARVIDDPEFASLKPDYAFALHNLPEFPLGSVIVRSNQFAATSSGLTIHLEGSTSHAGEPELGNSPTMAVANLITGLSALSQSTFPLHQSANVTIIHARIGNVAFGTSPGEATVMATLRAYEKEVMQSLSDSCVCLAEALAKAYGLKCQVNWCETFPPTVNAPEASSMVEEAVCRLGLTMQKPPHPFPWTEDFGHFTKLCKGALFGLGAGIDHPALHSPDYDFPDELIETGKSIFTEILNQILEK